MNVFVCSLSEQYSYNILTGSVYEKAIEREDDFFDMFVKSGFSLARVSLIEIDFV